MHGCRYGIGMHRHCPGLLRQNGNGSGGWGLASASNGGAFGRRMDSGAGYGYDSAADRIHSAHIRVKPIPKPAVGAEYRHWNNRGNETDVYAKYKVGHFYVGAGNRNYY